MGDRIRGESKSGSRVERGSVVSDLDLKAVMARYSRALDAKPSKGPWEDEKVAWITDSVADVPQLLSEIERLQDALAASYCEHGSTGDFLCTLVRLEPSSLSARAHMAENALRDFADHGLRADLSPTMNGSNVQTVFADAYAYLRRLDESVRERARRALGVDRG